MSLGTACGNVYTYAIGDLTAGNVPDDTETCYNTNCSYRCPAGLDAQVPDAIARMEEKAVQKHILINHAQLVI